MKEDWLEIAKNLPCGGKTKEVCCGNSPSCLVSHSEKGYSAHCFRCPVDDNHRFQSHGQRSIAEIQRHKQEIQENKNKPPHLPKDYTLDIPLEYAYFLKYGITLEVARRYKIGYSSFFHRIVIPIYNPHKDNKLEAVHLRSIDPNDKPKYINLGTPDKDLIFYSSMPIGYIRGYIIVEDVMSAIKLSMAGFNSVALNGSNITDVQAYRLANNGESRIFVWLDGDEAGKKGAKQVIKQMRLQGISDIRHIETESDPKHYRKDFIRDLIGDADIA